MSNSHWKTLLSSERLPCAVVDLDAFDRNALKMSAEVAGGTKTIRIATKSLRVPALLRRALKFGPPWSGLMCFSAEEALFLADQGFDDLMIAYPSVQSSDLEAVASLHSRGKRVSFVVDSPVGCDALAQKLRGTNTPLPIVIEVDMSLRLLGGLLHLGVRRSPIRTTSDLSAFLDLILKHPELKPVGIMAYEAQVAGLGDRNPFSPLLNPVKSFIRKLSVSSVARRREEMALPFIDRNLPLTLFNGGGTGSLSYCASERHLTELTAGSGFYCPHLFDYYSNLDLEPAAFFALQVVRASDARYVTCQGGGYIASGEPGWDRVPKPHWPEGLALVGTEGCGEVQTPLWVPSSVSLAAGDVVVFRHAKAGELMERFNEVLLLSGGKIVGREKTYRGLGLCFP